MPIIGDKVLNMNSAKQTATAKSISWSNRDDVYKKQKKFSSGFLIVPEFVPDSQIPLILSKEALEGVIQRITAFSQKADQLTHE